MNNIIRLYNNLVNIVKAIRNVYICKLLVCFAR